MERVRVGRGLGPAPQPARAAEREAPDAISGRGASGDFDGDGKTGIAVYGPYGPGGGGRIAILESGGGTISEAFGGPLDVPLPPPYVTTAAQTKAVGAQQPWPPQGG
jgi:hypothetical protein